MGKHQHKWIYENQGTMRTCECGKQEYLNDTTLLWEDDNCCTCPDCKGEGYILVNGMEQICANCDGTGIK